MTSQVDFNMSKCHISDEAYRHAQEVWREMNIQTMGEYHDLCLVCDVLLFVDLFEQFRCVLMKSYEFDPVQNYTLAGMCWSACLRNDKC
jgi:hypothetical protein